MCVMLCDASTSMSSFEPRPGGAPNFWYRSLSVLLVRLNRRGAPRKSKIGTPSRWIGRARLYTLPVRQTRVAASTPSGVSRFNVPRSSSAPHRPQFPVMSPSIRRVCPHDRFGGVTSAAPTHAPTRRTGPTLRLERKFWDAGDKVVCGIDEVGRGAWAGPVTVAAVVPAPEHVRGVRDSKQLTRTQREAAAHAVRRWAVAVGVGHASYEECDELGMTAALRTAGMRALAQLDAQGFTPDRIVLDGNHDYLRLGSRVTTVIKGDATCLAVAAASCVAKVTRDHMMMEEAEHYPPYDFESNVGYPAPAHKTTLAGYGPSAIHRRSWIFMDSLCWRGVPPAPGRLFI